MRSRAPEEMNDKILRYLSAASYVVFHSVLRSGGGKHGLAFFGSFFGHAKMNIRLLLSYFIDYLKSFLDKLFCASLINF